MNKKKTGNSIEKMGKYLNRKVSTQESGKHEKTIKFTNH